MKSVFFIGGLKNHNRELRFADPHNMKLHTFVVTPSGEDQTLSCVAIGDKPISYSWYKNSHHVPKERRDFLLNVQGPQLVLKELTSVDSGNYTCRAKNKYDEIEFQFQLKVQGIPNYFHRVKYRNFTKFPGVEILWKGKVAA